MIFCQIPSPTTAVLNLVVLVVNYPGGFGSLVTYPALVLRYMEGGVVTTALQEYYYGGCHNSHLQGDTGSLCNVYMYQPIDTGVL